jgi:phage terminase large subunit-like protein
VRRDHAGFVTLAADHVNQRVRVADLNEWAPLPGREIQLMEIREAVRKSRDTFGLGAVFYDPSQAELMAQELRREGLTMIPVSQTGKPAAAQATAILEAFRSHRIDLYKDPRLLRDLKKLRLIERSYGLRLEAVRDEHGHADIAKALSFALPETMQLSHLVWFDNNGAGFDIEVATV